MTLTWAQCSTLLKTLDFKVRADMEAYRLCLEHSDNLQESVNHMVAMEHPAFTAALAALVRAKFK